MKIQIREKGGVHMTIPIPTAPAASLVSSRIVTKIIMKVLEEEKENVFPAGWTRAETEAAIKKAQKGLQKCLKQYRGLTLVEVEEADGDYIKVVL